MFVLETKKQKLARILRNYIYKGLKIIKNQLFPLAFYKNPIFKQN